jgi:hypothetical protein
LGTPKVGLLNQIIGLGSSFILANEELALQRNYSAKIFRTIGEFEAKD